MKLHTNSLVHSELSKLNHEIQHLKTRLNRKNKIIQEILEGTLACYRDVFISSDYEYISPSFKKMFGYEDHEIANHPSSWEKLVHPDDLPMFFSNLEKHIESKGILPYSNEIRCFHKNGHIVWVYYKGKVIEWDNNGNPTRMVVSHMDITDLKKTQIEYENELKKKVNLLEHKNSELEQFAYIASHDLQEPLRTITSFIALTRKQYAGKIDDNIDTYMRYMSEAAQRSKRLIEGLLDYSRLGRKAKVTTIDCNNLISSLIQDLDHLVKEKSAKINYQNLPTIRCFESETTQLFQNLITNAIKFCSNNIHPEINIKGHTKDGKNYFQVQDNGIGIDPKNAEKIFMIFKRLHLQKEYKGSGIGLAHCKKIVELHHGHIRVESQIGKGSTFLFTLENMQTK